MKRWLLEFSLEAERDLFKLDHAIQRRIIGKLDWLLENFDIIFPSVLTAEFRDFYKLRVSDWRIIYKVDWPNYKIVVFYIDRRDKIYKKK